MYHVDKQKIHGKIKQDKKPINARNSMIHRRRLWRTFSTSKSNGASCSYSASCSDCSSRSSSSCCTSYARQTCQYKLSKSVDMFTTVKTTAKMYMTTRYYKNCLTKCKSFLSTGTANKAFSIKCHSVASQTLSHKCHCRLSSNFTDHILWSSNVYII